MYFHEKQITWAKNFESSHIDSLAINSKENLILLNLIENNENEKAIRFLDHMLVSSHTVFLGSKNYPDSSNLEVVKMIDSVEKYKDKRNQKQ